MIISDIILNTYNSHMFFFLGKLRNLVYSRLWKNLQEGNLERHFMKVLKNNCWSFEPNYYGF